MMDSRADEQLIADYLAGDRTALAGIYDRYADALYSTAAAMLSDRHEAADATQDVFLIAAERLDQLRDPTRLKPWLFAILRNQVFSRTKRRSRTRVVDFNDPEAPEMAAPIDQRAEGEEIAYAELANMVRDAAAGLDPRDQMVLQYSLRQDLSGPDLADALGVSLEQSYVVVHRMRQRVDRTLGALTVARMGRKDCPELATVLSGWDGTFNVLIRKRVARHVENCSTCERTKRKYAVLPIMAAGPALAAPPDLRDRVLGRIGRPGAIPHVTYAFDEPGGFPKPLRTGRRRLALVAASSVVALVLLGGGLAIARDDGGSGSAGVSASLPQPPQTVSSTTPSTAATNPPVTDAPTTDAQTSDPQTSDPPTSATSATSDTPTTVVVTEPASTDAPATVVTALPVAIGHVGVVDTTVVLAPDVTPPPTRPPTTAAPPTTSAPGAPTTTAPTTATTTPPTTAAPAATPGVLQLSTTFLDLSGSGAGTLNVSNSGQLPLTWTLDAAGAGPFRASTSFGSLAPGQSSAVSFTLDRSAAPEGTVVRNVQFNSAYGGGPVQLSATTERPPAVSISQGPPNPVCPQGKPLTVVATVTDESGVASVQLGWSGPGGSGSAAMQGSGTYSANLGLAPVDGHWTYTVTATDSRGNVGTASGSTEVACQNPG